MNVSGGALGIVAVALGIWGIVLMINTIMEANEQARFERECVNQFGSSEGLSDWCSEEIGESLKELVDERE